MLVAIAGGVTYAVAEIGGGVINGCYKSQNGQLRLIDPATDSCLPSETPLSWSQTGQQGPMGDKGDKGDPGPPGPEARFMAATTTGEPGVLFGGLDANEVAVIGYDTTGGFVDPPVPFKVVVFCASVSASAQALRVNTQKSTKPLRSNPVDRSSARGRKGH